MNVSWGISTGLLLAVAVSTQQAVSLERMKWLSGCWELRRANRVTLEMWMPPAGAEVMIGGSRTTVNGTLRDSEFTRISVSGNRLLFTAMPLNQATDSFPSKEISDTSVVFENLSHDYPQRVMYFKRGTDSIIGRIDGKHPDGKQQAIDFPMKRVPCTG